MKRGTNYIGVGVGAIIINKEGKIVLLLRGKQAEKESGKWEIPGGAVEFGETLSQALKREIYEEINVEIEVVELLEVSDHIFVDEKQHWVSLTYLCRITSGKPIIAEAEKSEALGWYTLEEANKLPLSVLTINDIKSIEKKFPLGLKHFYENWY